ncbi:class F sortase [Pimelobacter simplex]|uniref:Class F sortase n=3 Tax=Nocardioides simplex TaxID=2045 RepID=A0A7J5E469_NOCSI|nr:class F sortase [Pimelobacter simplex]KAB2812963.1 class F sortase [Pimelobacter simplex]
MRTLTRARQALGALVVTAIAATGLLAVTTVAAEAHQGSIRVTGAVCVDADTIQATYRWSWSNVPRASYGTRVVRKTGTTAFEGSWSGRGGAPLTTVSTASGSVSWTVTLRRAQFSGGNGPWEYVYAPWTDGYTGNRYNDTRVEGVDWNRCAPPAPARDATAAVSTTPPTCDTAETLVLGGTANATWGTPTRTTGPGAYSVVATATDGHVFADGARTRTFTGSLADRRSGQECAGPVPADERQTRPVAGTPDCGPRMVTSWTEERTRSYGWSAAEGRYVPGAWSTWTKVAGSERTAPATDEQCPPAATPDATAAVSTTPPTCDTAETLVLGGTANATWGTPTRTTGPGAYSVVATATDGHVFADGARTRTFTGALADRRSGQECAGPAPAAEVESRTVPGAPDCVTRTVTSWSEVRSRGYEWSAAEGRYLPGAWTPWTRTPGSEQTVPATDQQCPPRPAVPVAVRGAVAKLDKCGRNDFYRAVKVTGIRYVVGRSTVPQGVWVKARTKVVKVRVLAASRAYRVVGKKVIKVRFPYTCSCAAPPVTSPATGARPAARTASSRLVIPRTATDAKVVTVPVRKGRLAVGRELTGTVYTWNQGDPPCDPLGTTVYAGHAWRAGAGVADRWGTLRPGDRFRVGGCSFRVTKVAHWPATRSVKGLFRVDGAPRVVLIACKPGDYSQRTMVFARKIG